MNDIIEALDRLMRLDRRWRPHPERASGGTKYIATFQNRRGDTIALDRGSGSRNAIWVLARLAPPSLMSTMEHETYGLGDGRNSNLSVPQLKGKPLVRFYPKTLDEARELVNHLAGS